MGLTAVLLLLGASRPFPSALHLEDAKVFEAALERYWTLEETSDGVFVPDHTFGPFGNLGTALVGAGGLPLSGGDPVLRKSLESRNGTVGALRWFHPRSRRLHLLSSTATEPPNGSIAPYRQYAWLLFPGYSPRRDHAIVCFGFNCGDHPGRATIWLTRRKAR